MDRLIDCLGWSTNFAVLSVFGTVLGSTRWGVENWMQPKRTHSQLIAASFVIIFFFGRILVLCLNTRTRTSVLNHLERDYNNQLKFWKSFKWKKDKNHLTQLLDVILELKHSWVLSYKFIIRVRQRRCKKKGKHQLIAFHSMPFMLSLSSFPMPKKLAHYCSELLNWLLTSSASYNTFSLIPHLNFLQLEVIRQLTRVSILTQLLIFVL